MILITLIKFHKISAPSPYADYKVLVFFGLKLSGAKLFCVDRVKLKLMSARKNVGSYKLGNLSYA